MGSLSFKFKKPINCAYAPGRTTIGKKGEDGDSGENGTALYFIDYELNNSYIIELTQQKLENNYMLSGESEKISDVRKYRFGDLIISNSGNCYRIIKGTGYYTYDIEYIGRISSTIDENEYSVISVYMYELSDSSTYNYIQDGFVPNNRQYLIDTSTSENISTIAVNPDFSNNASDISTNAFKLYGKWYKFIIGTNIDFGNDTEFTVELNLKNTKTYQGSSIFNNSNELISDPVEDRNLYHILPFYKTLEFKAPSIIDASIGTIFSDEIPEYGGIKPYYISDMCLDKMHLFGNEIKQMVAEKNGNIYCLTGDFNDQSLKKVDDENISIAMQTRNVPQSSTRFIPAVYSIYNNNFLNTVNKDDINWRGGESAYFSSSSIDTIYNRISDFIKSDENMIRVIAYNHSTNEIKAFDNFKFKKIVL